jgi:hypothetical protein
MPRRKSKSNHVVLYVLGVVCVGLLIAALFFGVFGVNFSFGSGHLFSNSNGYAYTSPDCYTGSLGNSNTNALSNTNS